MPQSAQRPSIATKLMFWILLGVLSVFFAEVISGSTPLPMFSPWGILVVFPLYTLHTLFFAYIVYRHGQPRFHTLYLAGALFGMYEAYQTGILWAGWSEPPAITISEVGVIETLVLVFFWHPVLAFIFPVIFAHKFLTRSPAAITDFDRFFNRKTLVFMAVVFAFFQSLNMSGPVMALAVDLANIAGMMTVVLVWKKLGLDRFSMQALLPDKTGFIVIIVLLALQYAFLGVVSFSNYPGLAGHLGVITLYVVLAGLFIKSLRSSRQSLVGPMSSTTLNWRYLFGISGIFTAASVFFASWIWVAQPWVWIPVLLIYCLVGLTLFTASLRQLFRRS